MERSKPSAEDSAPESAGEKRLIRGRWRQGESSSKEDTVVREEPLEIRIGGVPVAVLMRTPGHDLELVRGFLRTEGIVGDPKAIRSIRHCSQVDEPEAEDNVIQVVLHDPASVDLSALRRNIYSSSSCGICGKASIDRVMSVAPPLPESRLQISVSQIYRLPKQLRRGQPLFSQTGGAHAAGLFSVGGETKVVREDVGRHNAVDKAIGWSIEHGHPLHDRVLAVSGRVSFEIVQKALWAGIPVIVAVSAPTSLAVELAEASNMTLAAFVRESTMSVYTGESRVFHDGGEIG